MYVISYDISKDSLRAKVAKELENYGRRIQYSVFECELSKVRFQELYGKLCQLTLKMEDGSIRKGNCFVQGGKSADCGTFLYAG